MPDSPTWYRSREIWTADEVGGDEQVGECYTARYLNDQLPGAVIDVHCYVLGPTDDNPVQPWALRWAATYTLCEDPGRPGDTERWCDVVYRQYLQDGRLDSQAEAEAAALAELEAFDPWVLTWDGEPEVTELFPYG